ncbi:MAG: hypothetical protein DRP37_05495 [Thermodesulfobacteriota bacterium]|nr:MAG: hypothetical protein DRP37_05495 [Thermodesulfobacteriota bacterium]
MVGVPGASGEGCDNIKKKASLKNSKKAFGERRVGKNKKFFLIVFVYVYVYYKQTSCHLFQKTIFL